MAYIGRQPTVGNFRICDAISVVNGQAAYTMQVGSVNVSPESANNMIVSLNGVIQKPGSSYTVSSSTITFSSNLSTGDVIDFIQILGGVANIGTPSDGTVTSAKLANSALMTPSFEAYLSANQGISDNTATKVQFNTEVFDTGDCYDNSTNYRFTPTTAGKYFVYSRVQFDAQAANNFQQGFLKIYKNGSAVTSTQMNMNGNFPENIHVLNHSIIDFNGSSDYVEVFGTIDDTSGTPTFRGTSFPWSVFGAYRIIGA